MKTMISLGMFTLLAVCSMAAETPDAKVCTEATAFVIKLQAKMVVVDTSDLSKITEDQKKGLCDEFKSVGDEKRKAYAKCYTEDAVKKVFGAGKRLCIPTTGTGRKPGSGGATKPGSGGVTKPRTRPGSGGDKPVTKPRPKPGSGGDKPVTKPGSGGDKPDVVTCAAAKAFLAGLKTKSSGMDLSDLSKITADQKKLLCTSFEALGADKKKAYARCSEDTRKVFGAAKTQCTGGKPGSGGVTKPETNPLICSKPTEATSDNCKKSKFGEVEGMCRTQLIKSCIEKGLDGCDDIKASATLCKREKLGELLKKRSECFARVTGLCRKEKKDDTTEKPIPAGCKTWFDGCNICKVAGDKKICGKKFCSKKAEALCKEFSDGKKCEMSRRTGKSECAKDGETRPTPKKPTCEDVKTSLDMTSKTQCLKASYLCKGDAGILASCRVEAEKAFKAACATTTDKRTKEICCVQGKLEGAACADFGGKDKLPSDCKTRCTEDGKFKVSDKDCRRCRGAGDIRPDSLKDKDDKDGKKTKKPFDPARVKDSIKDVASGLNEGGKACVKRVAKAASLLKTQIRRWSKDEPDKEEEPTEEVELKSIADVQAELDETAESSKVLEDEFEGDEDGKKFRGDAKNEGAVLKDTISDDNKPKKCGAEFVALKTAFNKIVEEYKGLPAKLKGDGVKRVPLKFEDIDIGSTDLKDSKRVCEFAKKLVTRLKDAEDNHKKRLAAARKLVCTKAGDLLKNKLVTNLVKCLRDAKKAADKGGDATAKKDAKDDVDKVDNNGLKRVKKLLGLLKKKCLMKDTAKSRPARVAGLFKEKLKTKIKRKKTGALTADEKKKIADTLSTAVKKKHEKATNIETTFSDDKGTRRQLRPRRELEGTVSVETTYDLDEPSKASDKVDVDLGTDFDVVETDVSSDSTSGTIEVTEKLSEISAELPTGEDKGKDTGATTPKTGATTPKKDGDDTSKETTQKAKVDSGATFFVSASAICATLLFV